MLLYPYQCVYFNFWYILETWYYSKKIRREKEGKDWGQMSFQSSAEAPREENGDTHLQVVTWVSVSYLVQIKVFHSFSKDCHDAFCTELLHRGIWHLFSVNSHSPWSQRSRIRWVLWPAFLCNSSAYLGWHSNHTSFIWFYLSPNFSLHCNQRALSNIETW